MPLSEDRPQKTVRAVERTLNILFIVAGAPEPMGLAEISEASGLDKATTLRLLATIEAFRLVRRDETTRKYTIGAGAWQLASSSQAELKALAEIHLRVLRDRTGESVSLVVARGLDRVVLMAMEATHELRVVPAINKVVPVYSGASGKVLMAFMREAERDRVIELTELKPVNERAVTDRASFLASLDEVRKSGFASSAGDVTFGTVAVAAPVFGASEDVAAVVSLRGPEARLSPERVAQLAPLVIEAARNISDDLNGRETRPRLVQA